MTRKTQPEALRLADDCEESAQAWAHEIDTRQRAAAELRRLHAQAAQDETLLRQALERLEAVVEHFDPYMGDNECRPMENARYTIAALRERLGEGEPSDARTAHGLSLEAIAPESTARMLAAALREVHELAGWYADDEADAEDESPDDMVAHVNGLIRQICAKAIRAVKEQA